jgi:hypothetical protein
MGPRIEYLHSVFSRNFTTVKTVLSASKQQWPSHWFVRGIFYFRALISSEDGGGKFLRNAGFYRPVHMVSQPRLKSSKFTERIGITQFTSCINSLYRSRLLKKETVSVSTGYRGPT